MGVKELYFNIAILYMRHQFVNVTTSTNFCHYPFIVFNIFTVKLFAMFLINKFDSILRDFLRYCNVKVYVKE